MPLAEGVFFLPLEEFLQKLFSVYSPGVFTLTNHSAGAFGGMTEVLAIKIDMIAEEEKLKRMYVRK